MKTAKQHMEKLSQDPAARRLGREQQEALKPNKIELAARREAEEAELNKLAAEDPIMALAKQELEKVSEDPVFRRLARKRQESIMLYHMDLAASRAEGEKAGKTELVLKLLNLRFNGLSETAHATVESATVEKLERWAELVLTAKTLEEMFAEEA